MAIIEPPAYVQDVTRATVSVSYFYYQINDLDISSVAFTYAYIEPTQEDKQPETEATNWKELRRHFNGFKAKHFNVNNSSYNIRQPMKCHRNVRRERIHRLKKSLV